MRFASPWFLLLLLLLLILYRFWRRKGQPPRVVYSLPLPSRIRSVDPWKWLLSLKILGLVFLILALARPQESYEENQRKVSGIDIILVMDVSMSMEIQDLSEQSRFEMAKETMRAFIQGRKDDRIGFVVFSGEALTLAPPTLDYGLVLQALQNAEIGVLKDGTAIGDGLSVAVNRLRNSQAKSRVIILLTDGDNNVGQVDPATAGDLAAGYGIRVYTIAIGREGRVRLPIKQPGPFGNMIQTYQWFENALNPELLQHIAKVSNGKFYRVTEGDALNQVFKEIDQLEKTEVESKDKVKYEDAYEFFLKLGILLFLLERVLALGWWRLAV